MEKQNNTYALLIGVGDDLPYTIKDAENLYANFTDKNLIGYPKNNVILLTGKEATKEGILEAFDTLKQKTDEESTIFLYYSGHGGRLSADNKFFLQPYGMTLENFYSTYLTADELRDKVNALPSNRLAFFLDCCHAEGMVQTGINGLSGMAQKLNDDSGIWVMASCQDNQKSYGAENQSFFTQCLLEVLSGTHKRPFTDPEISIMDVVEYIFEEVPKRAIEYTDEENNPCVQTPFFKTQMSENLILSYFSKNIENHELTIAQLEPKAKKLDEDSFIKLIKAMEAVGRVDDAIDTLNNNKRTQSDPDLLEALGDLFRNKYLKNKLQVEGEKALECHKKALDLAISTDDEEQVFTNAVKIAFMYANLDMNKKEMRDYATKAMKAAQSYLYPSINKLATMAEANIYLANIDEAKKNYKKVAAKAGIRYRMKCYEQAVSVYNTLFQPENQKDAFLVFLEETLLS
jgi:hypothetical protein